MHRSGRIALALRRGLTSLSTIKHPSQGVYVVTAKYYSTSPTHQSNYESLVERSLYLKTPFARSANAKIASTKITDGGKNVEVVWDDGEKSRFHSLWLRHCCHCEACRLPTNQCIVNMADVDLSITITHAAVEDEKVLQVQWGDDENHTGLFPLPFLKFHIYSEKALSERARLKDMSFHVKSTVPEVSYSDVMNTEEGLYRWLTNLGEHGLCLVKNVPKRDLEVTKVAERIGPLQATMYGETFDVKDKPKPENFAYTSLGLGLHMDQIMYESPPGIQLLHCLRFDKEVEGGNNIFVDLYHVAEKLRVEHPKEFNDLVRIPVTWETIHYDRDVPVHMTFQRPHISLNPDGTVVGMMWHPSQVGPLQVKEEDIEPYYRAHKVLAQRVNNFEHTYHLRLEPGDLISFQNRRALHGRDQYVSNGGLRHLQGCYVQIDDFKSQLQVYRNKYGGGKLATRVGNMDWQ